MTKILVGFRFVVRPQPPSYVARPVAPLPPLIFSPQKTLLNLWPRGLFLGQAMLRGRSGWKLLRKYRLPCCLSPYRSPPRSNLPSPVPSLFSMLPARPSSSRAPPSPSSSVPALPSPVLGPAWGSTSTSPRMNNNTSPPPSFSHHHARRSALRRRRRTPVLTNRIADHSTTPYLRGSPLTIQIGCLPLSSAQAACFQITFEHHPPVCILLADPFKCVHVASCLADPIDCLRTLKKFLAGRSNKRFPAASLFQRGSACV